MSGISQGDASDKQIQFSQPIQSWESKTDHERFNELLERMTELERQVEKLNETISLLFPSHFGIYKDVK